MENAYATAVFKKDFSELESTYRKQEEVYIDLSNSYQLAYQAYYLAHSYLQRCENTVAVIQSLSSKILAHRGRNFSQEDFRPDHLKGMSTLTKGGLLISGGVAFGGGMYSSWCSASAESAKATGNAAQAANATSHANIANKVSLGGGVLFLALTVATVAIDLKAFHDSVTAKGNELELENKTLSTNIDILGREIASVKEKHDTINQRLQVLFNYTKNALQGFGPDSPGSESPDNNVTPENLPEKLSEVRDRLIEMQVREQFESQQSENSDLSDIEQEFESDIQHGFESDIEQEFEEV